MAKRRRRYNPPRDIIKERIKQDEFLRSVGYRPSEKSDKPQRLTKADYDISVPDKPGLAECSNNVPTGAGWKRSRDDYKWKVGAEESTETIVEIERKAKRIAPQYSKGAAQYITDGTDIQTLGKKV